MLELTDQNFMREISSGVCIVDFYADWCQPCKPVAALLEKYEAKTDKIKFLKVNVEKCQHASRYFNISNLPTVYVIVDGVLHTAVFMDFEKAIKRIVETFA